MENYLRGTGRIVYDPFRAGKFDPNWCVVEVDTEITRYYRYWLQKEKHIILQKPSWDAHISVVRGERRANKYPQLWKKYHGQKVDFLYEHGVVRCARDKDQPGLFYWVDVECPLLNKIRTELDLPTGMRFHVTIGRTYYENIALPAGDRSILI